jgi:hypothetical protein
MLTNEEKNVFTKYVQQLPECREDNNLCHLYDNDKVKYFKFCFLYNYKKSFEEVITPILEKDYLSW